MRDQAFYQVCASAVQTYGADAQLCQIQEEAAELIAAISHFRRGRQGSREELLDELADMDIMLEQARVIFGDDAVTSAATPKIERLCERLGTGHGVG